MSAIPGPATRWGRILQGAGVFAACFLLRSIYVSLFACDLPQWDQWDAEGDHLLRAWMHGTWHVADLFSSHNEHRIAFTRLISLAIFEANSGQWDNLVEAYVNAGIFSTMLTLLWTLLNRNGIATSLRTASALTVLLIAALPFSWENALVGFQSQFYLMAIAAIAMIGIVSYMRPSRLMVVWLLVTGVASLFTMASGLIAAVACIATIVVRAWREPLGHKFLFVSVGLLAAISVTGLLLVPTIPGHEAYKAQGMVDHVRGLAVVLMWPLEPRMRHLQSTFTMLLVAMIMWAPMLLLSFRVLRRRQASSQELFAIGVAIWVLLQAAAIAHSRGHGIEVMASRYMDIPAIGSLVNAWLTLAALQRRELNRNVFRIGVASSALFVTGLAVGLHKRTPDDLSLALDRNNHTTEQTRNVRNYVRSGNFADLDKPFFTIPYPDARRLQSLLDDPLVKAMLPVSVRTPLWLPRDIGGFTRENLPSTLIGDTPATAIGSYASANGNAYIGAMISPDVRSAFPMAMIEVVGGRIGKKGLSVALQSSSGMTPLVLRRQAGLRWTAVYTAAPSGAFRVSAIDDTKDSWLGLSAPVESGVLSAWAHRFQDFTIRHMRKSVGAPYAP
ncbi:hypothetical protein SAMN02800694_0712 [Luteibacter sp. UNCMF331Sha3.1]|uniref:hypothetical protein n=1 Tax=Luteibacter sp. UNCMF331Sha3.1 TaxID=1502760 RepID=UPI0008C8FC8E|nr:hypothetical protein [Luteibacter sp. UNCMF331Sha3.1]SEM34222.1 hypothetical protein SAMN02800694_0712 [Luteibacter sp. UNCMF331Sha3.1]